MKIIRDLENKVNQLADDLVKADKEPEKFTKTLETLSFKVDLAQQKKN